MYANCNIINPKNKHLFSFIMLHPMQCDSNYFNDFFDPTRTEILRPSKLTPENASSPQSGIGRWITNPTQYFVVEDD